MKITSRGYAVIENDTHISKWVEQSGRLDHDQNMLPLILKHIKQGDTVIDIGAYIGDHTISYARAVGHTGIVHAFEPNYAAFQCLEWNMKKHPQVKIYQCGIGKDHRTLGLVSENKNHGMAYMKGDGNIPVIPIDSMNLTRCDFIKIDVEGMELDVLMGAEKTIGRCKPQLLIEINDMTLNRAGITAEGIFQWLNSHGYRYRNIYHEQGINDAQFDLFAYFVYE